MPIPTPNDGESESDFIERCMSNDTMKEDYPDNDQRLAVCYGSWKENKSMSKEVEYREFAVEMRVVEDEDKAPTITGHAAVFNKLSEPLGFGGGFREKIAPGFFSAAIGRDDVRALFNHDPNYVLGRTKSGTLDLFEDSRGLAVSISPPDTQWANDLVVSMKRGDITQMSFGFTTKTDMWERGKNEDIRTLIEIERLYDVSPVTYPAYPQTDVKVRAAFATAGIDYDAIRGIIFRSDHGRELSDSDRAVVAETIEVLQRYLVVEEPDVEGLQKTGASDSLQMLRLRLKTLK